MTILNLFDNLGILVDVVWLRHDGIRTKIVERTVQGEIRVHYQWPLTNAWIHSSETWDDESFLKNFEPERPSQDSVQEVETRG